MFVKVNMNPKDIRAGDCVVRAISYASGFEYSDVYWDLCNIAYEMCRMPNEKQVYEKYLKEIGFVKQKMPKHEDNTRYTVYELVEELSKVYNGCAVVTVANHMTCVRDGNTYDTWDCRHKSVGNFWIKSENLIG